MASPIYSHPWLLELALRAKYGRYYLPRLERVAREIGNGDRVVDLCCGDAAIYRRLLRHRQVCYQGIEFNRSMVQALERRDINVLWGDVRRVAIPRCDVVLCLASLYQFPQHAAGIIRAATAAAPRVVILEPVENMASAGNPLLVAVGRYITDFGEGPVTFRYSEEELRRQWQELRVAKMERLGPELLGIWRS